VARRKRLIGLDPGLRKTGWGIVDFDGITISYVQCGVILPPVGDDMSRRLAFLHESLFRVLKKWQPESAAIEETFVNKNAASTLKLGQARGVVMLTPALVGLEVAEYHNRVVKLSVVGTGRAAKQQIHVMVKHLLPGANPESEDEADALAIAICHAHHSSRKIEGLGAGAHK
tara:strand:- start:1413 stop:1928 length:516 start_codon:yes stop_codon:yes gene_type:complete